MISHPPLEFDRQLQLSDLFSTGELSEIQASLSSLLGQPVEITGPDSLPRPDFQRAGIHWEFEAIGYLESKDVSGLQLQAALNLLLILIKNGARYRMASDLHKETVRSDYQLLQEQHTALQESEKRYRLLAKELEQKVAAQVKTLESAQVKLYHSEKLASVGQLAAGMAHELNSPLAYIQNNLVSATSYVDTIKTIGKLINDGIGLEAMKEYWDNEDMAFILEDFPSLLQDSLQGVEKVATIVADLKVFSNINQSEQRMDNINDRLDTVLKMLKPLLGSEIEVVCELAKIPTTLCYPAHLGQVFYNLILNSGQAIKKKGKITIRTRVQKGEICVVIQDTGSGISKADLSRIFDPFFTTKEVGTGTGLGLTVINDVVKAHGGRIVVESQVGLGSIFSVFLPVKTEVV